MLIAFDANISFRLVDALKASSILDNFNVDIIHVGRQYGKGIHDTAWIERFSVDGGEAFITADKRIRTRPAERNAYKNKGLKAIFLLSRWHDWDWNQRIALIFLKWPHIHSKIQTMRAGESCELIVNLSLNAQFTNHFRSL